MTSHSSICDQIVPGVFRFGSKRVNWYVVEADGKLTVIDAGLPGHFPQLVDALDEFGYSRDDIAAVVLTHGHDDHIGFAERLREETGVPVMVHTADEALVEGSEDASPVDILRNLWRPAVLGLLIELIRSGGLSTPSVEAIETFEDGESLDVPGTPSVIHVPGHSDGSCVLYVPERELVFCGDVFATMDLKTNRTDGPQIMSMFNKNREQAVESLTRLESLDQITLLPGHGPSWDGVMSDAIQQARESVR